ncbi:MAG: SBBP repeat-containing protein [Bacteroidota bacterium]
MKTFILFAFIVLFSARAVNSQSFTWANSAGGTGTDEGKSIAVDASGNVYVAGSFNSASITFGTTPPLENSGNSDVFLVKYDAAGNVLWAQSAGGKYADYGRSVAVDGSGNIYMTGDFSSQEISFGTETLTNTDEGSADIFLVKFNSDGNVLWAQSYGTAYTDRGISVVTDASGNVYMTGCFSSAQITFGTTPPIENAGNSDVFLVKYDAAGDVLWAKSAGGTGNDYGKSVAVDASGNIYVTGDYNSPAIAVNSTTLTNVNSAGTSDIFLSKYDTNGNLIWAKSAGGSANDLAESVAADPLGNVYAAGNFSSKTFTADPATLWNSTDDGTTDIFLLKYGIDGNLLLTKKPAGPSSDYCLSVATDAAGNVYMAGYSYSSSMVFGLPAPLSKANNDGTTDILLFKYDAGANPLWAQSTGGTGADYCNSAAVDASGNVHVAGSFVSPTITFGSAVLNNSGGYDFFVAKLLRESGSLPVELASFGNACNGRDVQLKWTTATEVNVSGFEIQRTQGDEWMTISFVEGAGNSNSSRSYLFVDRQLNVGKYQYRLKMLDTDGSFRYSEIINATVSVPEHFSLLQNYPNPFNPSTKIEYSIPTSGKVKLDVFSVTGQLVRTLINSRQEAGYYSADFDAASLPSGVYLYRLQSGEFSETKKLLLIK